MKWLIGWLSRLWRCIRDLVGLSPSPAIPPTEPEPAPPARDVTSEPAVADEAEDPGLALDPLPVLPDRAEPLSPAPLRYAVETVDEPPDYASAGVVYLVGEGAGFWCMLLVCPCGCGELISLNTLSSVRPHWRVRTDADTVSIWPSVHRTRGCRSHFFITRSRVEWCHHLGSTHAEEFDDG